eukprot:gnl/MRDRNA2_/MRDRNA2_185354_c0_seq1.p1 gnl/MRDRNA2_/MRDRNA2_185354_c0~~gnl/MRDRNA2_/MRDRNA2_185354_c0_seq1.p1  ORF type:complete len:175 (+),score=51.52 gnl/MRDRNA2_/MRDRNA2_185354_c0_seq1:114-638(+)
MIAGYPAPVVQCSTIEPFKKIEGKGMQDVAVQDVAVQEPMCRIDAQTYVPSGLFARWADAGARARMRHAHYPTEDDFDSFGKMTRICNFEMKDSKGAQRSSDSTPTMNFEAKDSEVVQSSDDSTPTMKFEMKDSEGVQSSDDSTPTMKFEMKDSEGVQSSNDSRPSMKLEMKGL